MQGKSLNTCFSAIRPESGLCQRPQPSYNAFLSIMWPESGLCGFYGSRQPVFKHHEAGKRIVSIPTTIVQCVFKQHVAGKRVVRFLRESYNTFLSTMRPESGLCQQPKMVLSVAPADCAPQGCTCLLPQGGPAEKHWELLLTS